MDSIFCFDVMALEGFEQFHSLSFKKNMFLSMNEEIASIFLSTASFLWFLEYADMFVHYYKGFSIPSRNNYCPLKFAMCHAHIRQDPLVSHVKTTSQHK